MLNIFSVDLEDWHQLVRRVLTGEPLAAPSAHVDRQMDVLLRLLDEHGVEATFFVLGALAEHRPEIVRRVAEAGHEIACHGYDHWRVYDLTPEAFREDVRRSKTLLEDLTGRPVRGFRAAEFSVRRAQAPWALGILADLGFTYDSSIFPIRHRRYGIPEFDPDAKRYALPNEKSITEVPLSAVSVWGVRVPVAGGGYFRYLPGAALEAATRRLGAQGRPLVTYFHPYEFDPQRLDAFETLAPESVAQRLRALRLNALQNVGRRSLLGKVERLLRAFPFTSFRDYLSRTTLPEGGALPFSGGPGGAGRPPRRARGTASASANPSLSANQKAAQNPA